MTATKLQHQHGQLDEDQTELAYFHSSYPEETDESKQVAK